MFFYYFCVHKKISKRFYYILFYLIKKTTEIMSSDTLYKGHLFEKLQEDYRIKEGLKACMNCGVCTAVCPAAEFYKYNPKNIVNIVQRKDEDELEALLKSDTIWYCGECMSCVTRCPRGNAPGLIIMALRKLAILNPGAGGYFQLASPFIMFVQCFFADIHEGCTFVS